MDKKDTKSFNGQRQAWEMFTVGPDEATFKTIFNYYYKPLYGYGVKLCSQPEVVKDSIHDLFETLWGRRHYLTHIESPNVYLFVSLRRRIMKELKKQRGQRNDLVETHEDDLIDFGYEEIIIRDEVKLQQKEELRQALNQLTDRQKEVLYLRYYNGLSYDEIKQVLSISRKSAYNHLYRALETLRSLLDMEIMNLVGSALVAILFFGILWG